VEILFDLALSLRAIAFVDKEERDEDDDNEGHDADASQYILVYRDLDNCSRRQVACIIRSAVVRLAHLVSRALLPESELLLATRARRVAVETRHAIVPGNDVGELGPI